MAAAGGYAGEGPTRNGLTMGPATATVVTERPSLRRIGIRQLRAAELERAAEQRQLLGLTSFNELVAVLVPLSQEWVDQVIADNLSRVLTSVRMGRIEALSSESVAPLDTLKPSDIDGPVRLRRVPIRGVTGEFVEALAKEGRTVAVTSSGRLVGLLVPVTAQWVEQLVDRSITRILQSAQIATKEAATGSLRPLGDHPIVDPA